MCHLQKVLDEPWKVSVWNEMGDSEYSGPGREVEVLCRAASVGLPGIRRRRVRGSQKGCGLHGQGCWERRGRCEYVRGQGQEMHK